MQSIFNFVVWGALFAFLFAQLSKILFHRYNKGVWEAKQCLLSGGKIQ